MRRWLHPERLRRRVRPSVDSVAQRSTRSGSSKAASTRARTDVVIGFSAVGFIATLDLRPSCFLTIASWAGAVSTKGEVWGAASDLGTKGENDSHSHSTPWSPLPKPLSSLRHCLTDRYAMAQTPWYHWGQAGPGHPLGALWTSGSDPGGG